MKKYLVILFTIATMISACSPAEPALSLTGTTWTLTSYGRVDSPDPAVPESEGMIIFVNSGKVNGIGACNQFDGDYEVKGNQIVLGPFTWGMENCPEPKMTQEGNVWNVLRGTVDYKIEGKTLTISRSNIFLEFEALSNSTGN